MFLVHYDQDTQTGNPRIGWVKVGIINDLSSLISSGVASNAADLRHVWSENWQQMVVSEPMAKQIIQSIARVRHSVKAELKQLD